WVIERVQRRSRQGGGDKVASFDLLWSHVLIEPTQALRASRIQSTVYAKCPGFSDSPWRQYLSTHPILKFSFSFEHKHSSALCSHATRKSAARNTGPYDDQIVIDGHQWILGSRHSATVPGN